MAELADALDLGSSGQPCRFDPCYPHHKKHLHKGEERYVVDRIRSNKKGDDKPRFVSQTIGKYAKNLCYIFFKVCYESSCRKL